jgi:hypothetical protein
VRGSLDGHSVEARPIVERRNMEFAEERPLMVEAFLADVIKPYNMIAKILTPWVVRRPPCSLLPKHAHGFHRRYCESSSEIVTVSDDPLAKDDQQQEKVLQEL